MKRAALWMVTAGGLVLAGCAGDRTARRGDEPSVPPPVVSPRPQPEDRVAELERVTDESQPGRILTLAPDDERLIIDPFEAEAGDAHFHLPRTAQVFGEEFVNRPLGEGHSALEEGTPVRVHFDRRDDQQFPVVVRIEVLTEQQAQELDRSM